MSKNQRFEHLGSLVENLFLTIFCPLLGPPPPPPPAPHSHLAPMWYNVRPKNVHFKGLW